MLDAMDSPSPPRIIELPKITDQRGNLSYLNSAEHIPFELQRAYFVYDVPAGSVRGGHAHKSLHQLILAISGSFDVVVNDGSGEQTFSLNRPWRGLYVGPMIWRALENFSSGAVCLVLASRPYEEEDYIRDFGTYSVLRGNP